MGVFPKKTSVRDTEEILFINISDKLPKEMSMIFVLLFKPVSPKAETQCKCKFYCCCCIVYIIIFLLNYEQSFFLFTKINVLSRFSTKFNNSWHNFPDNFKNTFRMQKEV